MAGIPLEHVINEDNHRPWKRPSDPEGLWEKALANPRGYADFSIGFAGDPVFAASQKAELPSMVAIRTSGEPVAIIYWTQR